MFRRFILILTLSLSAFSSAYASEDDYFTKYFELLSKVPSLDTKIGSICERIALEELKHSYPDDDYRIYTNLKYYKDDGDELGELDIVVQHKDSSYVDLVVEVKCKENPNHAVGEAEIQLDRFQNHIMNLKQMDRTGLMSFKNKDKEKVYFSLSRFTRRTEYKYNLPWYRGRSLEGVVLPFSYYQIKSLSRKLQRFFRR